MSYKAFFVIGPESSGTRMLTQAFLSTGLYGDGGHGQRLDEGFHVKHNIVFRRSLPHAKQWPDLKRLIAQMTALEFDVTVIGILRDRRYTALSQQGKHADSMDEALANIKRAEMLVHEFSRHIVNYEEFVTLPSFRKSFFHMLGLEEPNMYFYNANKAYVGVDYEYPLA